MKNSEYWAQRFEMLESAAFNKAEDYYKELVNQYDLAIKSLERDIAVWYQRFASNNEISLAEARQWLNSKELEEFKWTVDDYIKYGKANAINPKWMAQLENASARVHISRLEALELQLRNQIETLYDGQLKGVNDLETNVYTDGYYHSAYEIQRGIGTGWTLQKLNSDQITKVLSKPWAADGLTFSDRIWRNKQELIATIHTQLTQSFIRGDAPDKAIKYIAERFNVSKRQAGALVMTESAFFAAASQKQCFNDLSVEKYEIVATLDNRTSEICRDLDGTVFLMSEYEVGVTAPPFHVRCRTVTAPHFDDEDEFAERAARNADGEVYYVPANMKYPDWYQAYVENNPAEKKKYKMLDNLKTDKIQFKNYKSVLGDEAPKTFDNFREIKYNNSDQYNDLTQQFKAAKQTAWEKKIIAEASAIDDFTVFETPKDIPDWAKNQISNWTDTEKKALSYYTTHNYSKINDYLRGKISAENGIQTKITNITKAINKSNIDDNIIIWRGTHFGNFTNGEVLKKLPLEQWIGRSIDDKAFSSTSILKSGSFSNSEIFMQILVPKNSKGAYISAISEFESEYEILLQQGSQFKIISADQRGGKYFIQVILIGG